MLTIVILNYNGWQDTIACLESLRAQEYSALRVVVADNGSTDESLANIQNWIDTNNIDCTCLQDGEKAVTDSWLYVLKLKKNYGFAAGNNKAIQALANMHSDYILCLNNDTVVASDCLSRLVAYADRHPGITALTPAIRLYAQPDIMWNAGGRLTFGGRRYYCCLQPANLLQGKHLLDITFVTGCALMVRPDVLDEGRLFSERFFFGEEDYEFSLRMQQNGHRMVCLLDALVYHKVSSSTRQITSYNKLFIHCLNRSINLRQHYSTAKYKVWEWLFYPYLKYRFLRSMTPEERKRFLSLLRQESHSNDNVSFELFNHYTTYPFKDE